MPRIESRISTRVGQAREGQGGRTAVVLVYVEDAGAAGRQSGWSAPVDALFKGWGKKPARDFCSRSRRVARDGRSRGSREALARDRFLELHEMPRVWPSRRCRRHRRDRWRSKAQLVSGFSPHPRRLCGGLLLSFVLKSQMSSHSARRASTGSRFAARRAGSQPLATPTSRLMTSAATAASGGVLKGNPGTAAASTAPAA